MPDTPKTLFRFDANAYVCVHCRPNSGVVQVTSNLADATVAKMYADSVRAIGGHVFATVQAGVLIAALQLIKEERRGAT